MGQITNTGQGNAMASQREQTRVRNALEEVRVMLVVAESWIDPYKMPAYKAEAKAAYMKIRKARMVQG